MTQADTSRSVAVRRFSWRRLFQYHLRMLLIVTAIIAIALGWWSYRARQQREAVAALTKIGGHILYDDSLPWTSGIKGAPKWPQWFLDKVGEDYFARVDSLDLINTQFIDVGMDNVKSLTALRIIWLDNTKVTDAGLEQLKGLTGLQVLSLAGTKVTDAGLEHLKGMIDLRILHLNNTNVTDAGVERLQKSLPECDISS